MPRSKGRHPAKAVYWWSQEIAELRSDSTHARRVYQRRRRQLPLPDLEEIQSLHEVYIQAKGRLQTAILRAKVQAREEFLKELDRDPWGRPYRMVRNKMVGQSVPTDSFQPRLLDEIMSGLFPTEDNTPTPHTSDESEEGEEISPITDVELEAAVLRFGGKKTAPGPDGVPRRVLALALRHLGGRFLDILNASLTTGRYPKVWKDGRLCLLKKEGRPAESPSAYRPIVLLDDAGKLFERILFSRIVKHLTEVGPDLSNNQYGFRSGRSTIDALKALKSLTEDATARGQRVLAVSLDIANAFNSLPFYCIEEALQYHAVPFHLRRLIGHYLSYREVLYQGRNGRLLTRRMDRGVPQGSVLGPLLWNLGYDWLLRGTLLPGMSVICYADDTLITAQGNSLEEAMRLATVGTALVVERIGLLGLRVALDKTEALLFHGPRARAPAGTHIVVDGVQVEVKAQLKYLGLILDGRWKFSEHFRLLAPRLLGAAAALSRLMPNLRGPGASCRRLYTGVIRSMALYGAPVWADALNAQNRAMLRRPQRVMAVRAIRGYRTVAYEAACALAGMLPWDLEAQVLVEVYQHKADARSNGDRPTMEEMRRVRERAREAAMLRWADRLETPGAGVRTVNAIRPELDRWVNRRHGQLTFRLVQVLTGHGCFGKYLHQVPRREVSPICHHCGAPTDTAQHTLEECSAWVVQREQLAAAIGENLSLPSIIIAMLDSETSWNAVSSFCEEVISQKEDAERVRETEAQADLLRRRRLGVRRRQFARLLDP